MPKSAVSSNNETRSAAGRALLGALRQQRQHVLGILEGLPEQALRRPVLPSGWTCLGLVRHLALDVERFWFRGVAVGEPVDQPANAWQVPPGEPASAVLDLYRREMALADAVIAVTPLDARRPAGRASGRTGGSVTCGRSSCT